MKVAVYPGSFDPVTLGHLDVIKRSLDLFDKLVVVVMQNTRKTPMFSADERVDLIMQSAEELGFDLSRLEVLHSSDLLANFAKKVGASVIVKGLRAVSDFESEFQMATANQVLNPELDSVFVMTRAEYIFLSSSIVREVAHFGGDIGSFVTKTVSDAIRRRKNG
ncbi:MAG: pantetheine-phosphate adenylyltransferase [Bacillota bacterium]|nr:pantetheine-phosphate adenylyltransferase [Bacillota bacterium]